VAWSLAETRMKILCLEQGDWMKSSDFPSNGRDWEARRYADFDISPNRRGRDTDYPVNDDGSPNPQFELNDPKLAGASILLARRNFGSGSSREHAPWALTQFGFRAVISTSFADIFKQNSLKNSLLPIVVPADVHAELFAALDANPDATVKIDLPAQILTTPAGREVEFPVDGFSKHCLVEGVDELGFILSREAEIAAFEAQRVGSVNTAE